MPTSFFIHWPPSLPPLAELLPELPEPEELPLEEPGHGAACWLCHPEYIRRFGETNREGKLHEK